MLSKTLGLFLPTNNYRTRLILGLVAAVLLTTFAGAIPAAGQNRSLPLYVADINDGLRTIDPLTGEEIDPIPVQNADGSGPSIDGVQSIAVHPTSGVLFGVFWVGPAFDHQEFGTVDPTTGDVTLIAPITLSGSLIETISDLTFIPDGTLYAITGRAFPPENTVLTINLTTGVATSVVDLTIGADDNRGNGISFNPEDDLIYHVTFDNTNTVPVIQTFDPAAADVAASVQTVTFNGPDAWINPRTIEYFGNDMFLVLDQNVDMFLVTAGGGSRFMNSSPIGNPHGLAFAGTPPAVCPQLLYGAAYDGPNGPSLFYSINPATGDTTLIGPVGLERVSGMDFLSTGALIATGERQDGTDTRVLIDIDPCTGLGTEIGPTGLSQIMDMSVRSDDVVVGVNDFTNLASFDTGTGAGANIAALAPDCSTSGGCGLAYDAADNLIFNNNRDPVTLVTVDDTTGVGTPLISLVAPPAIDTNLPRLNAMDFDPVTGTLFGSWIDDFGSNSLHYLVTADTATGDVVSLGETQSNLDAIAFLPGNFLADLAITKTISIASPVVGVNFTYTVTVTNNGPGDATGVTVVDTLPSPSFTTVSITPSKGTCSGTGTVTCTIGTLAAVDDPATTTVVENVATITIVGRATAAVALTNTATVTGNETDPDTSNNMAVSSTSSIVPQYTVALSPTSGSTSSGGTVTFTVTVTTTGAPILAPITLSCLVLNGSVVITCSFNPATVTPGATFATSTLTVTAVTTTGTASLGMPPGQQPGAPLFAVWLGLPVLAFLTTLGFGGGKKRLVFALAMALLVLSLLPMAGCNNNDVQPQPGPQTVTFVARGAIGGNTVNSNSATLTVTP